MLQRFKEKWGISSNTQLILIFIVFSLTGSAAVFAKKGIFFVLGIHPSELSTWLNVVLYILILFPAYQILLLVIGALFGQFSFFYAFQKKTLGRFFSKKIRKNHDQ